MWLWWLQRRRLSGVLPLSTLDFSPFKKVLVHIQNYLVPQAGFFLPSPPPFRTSDLIDETSDSFWKMVVVRGERGDADPTGKYESNLFSL